MTYIICLEGQDGVGKTTQINKLASYLESKGYETHYLKTPGHTPLGKDLRKLLLSPEQGKEIDGYAAVGLFLADMVDQYQRGMLPLLNKRGCFILLDRFWYSTWCYQTPDGVDCNLLRALFKDALPIDPDLKIFLDLPLAESLDRCRERGNLDYIESRPIEYHTSVYERYQTIVALEQFKRVPIKGMDIDSIHTAIVGLVDELTHLHRPAKSSVLA